MRNLFIITLAVMLICCHKDNEYKRVEEYDSEEFLCCPPSVNIQPLNGYTQQEAVVLIPKLRKAIKAYSHIDLDFNVLPTKQLPDSFIAAGTHKYKAKDIINSITESSNHNVVIAVTHDDICLDYKGRKNWGVLGLAYLSKVYTCVASDCRMKNKNDFWKVALHEFIHAYHQYNHCPKNDPTCIMQDCNGKGDFSRKNKLCHYCDSVLNI